MFIRAWGRFIFRQCHPYSMTLDEAYAHCKAVATTHYENFPVASILVPKWMRKHLYAIYAFSRKADDIADEGQDPASVRIKRLEELRTALREKSSTDPVLIALGATITTCNLPVDPFDRLLDAFVGDAAFTPPSTWEDVLAYCHNSANPVGELFLRLDYAGSEPPAEALNASNCICTALQITNFLQDLSIDLARNRSYLPVSAEQALECTRSLYDKGATVTRYVRSWRLKLELWAIMYGGRTMLELCAQRSDPMVRPTLSIMSLVLHPFRARW